MASLVHFHLFSSLPIEIRLFIFKLSVNRKPRIVEFAVDDNNIFHATTPPPPLLHVNQESREVLLRLYKPWLFNNVPESLRATNEWSCLNNVYLNYRQDMLLVTVRIDGATSDLDLFGSIEKSLLWNLAVRAPTGYETLDNRWRMQAANLNLKRLYVLGLSRRHGVQVVSTQEVDDLWSFSKYWRLCIGEF
jgi:hypothetical protein